MSFTDAVRSALERTTRPDRVGAVHDVVANAIRALDPRVEIRGTDYFNHSFVPDLVLRWGADERSKRHVHLRYSVVSELLVQDLRALADGAPFFLGMTEESRSFTEAPWANEAEIRGALITESRAVDELTEPEDRRIKRATSQIVRTGHGALDADHADDVGNTYEAALDAIDTTETTDPDAEQHVVAAMASLDQFLSEYAYLDVERALQSEWIRRGRDPSAFPGREEWRPELLDREALREVLNALLDSPRPVDPEAWVRNASHVRAEEIGDVLGRSLRGGRLNEMVHALLQYWTAKWAWAERLPSSQLVDAYDWIIDENRLGLEGADLRVLFADDGRHFKDKPQGEGLVPTLAEAQRLLSESGIVEVGMRSAVEGWRWMPLSTTTPVYERLSGLPDAHRTRLYSVRAQVPGADWVADLDLDRQVVDLDGQSTPIASLARLVFRFFSRTPDMERLDHFIGTGEDAPDHDPVEPAT